MIHDNDVFNAEIAKPFKVPADNWRKGFMAQRYTYTPYAQAWRVSGTVLNQDGSMHRGGQQEAALVNRADVPEVIRKQAQVFYDDLAGRLAARYQQTGLEALSEEHLTYDDDDDLAGDTDVEPSPISV